MEFRWMKIASAILVITLVSCGQDYEFALPESSDNFGAGATYNNKVDMIFIVDDSESMKYPQQNLLASLPGMIQKLMESKLDLHIAVITTTLGGDNPSGGKFIGNPKYFTSGTPNLAGVLASRLNVGTSGRPVEVGIDSLVRVLSDSYQKGDGQGFYREDALLAIIEITNEDDKSAAVSDMVETLDIIKKPFTHDDGTTTTRSWVFNLIGTLDTSSSCSTNPDRHYTERADKLMDLTLDSGGQMESICSTNYAPAVSNIRARIVQILTDFKLTRVPNLSTVKVYLNGALVPRSAVDGWDYISASNSIRFYGSWLPAADAKIRVDFLPAGAD